MSKREYDSNGWYEIQDTPLSIAGVHQYLGRNISPDLEPDKIYNVYRPEQELNNPETIKSFRLIPWIPLHEMLGGNYTAPEDVGVQGTTGENIKFIGGRLLGNIKVFGQELAKMIEDGVKDLSLGFHCTWIVKSGVAPDGTPYDAIQTEIRGNHLASVPVGRMGSDVAVMDHSVFALDQNDVVKINQTNGEDMTDLERANAKIAELEKQLAAKAPAKDEDEKAEDAKPEKGVNPFAKKDDAEDEKKDKGAMEAGLMADAIAAAIAPLAAEIETIKSSAVDANDIVKAIAAKNELASKSAAIVGAFDHSDMDTQGVAKYALEKIGMACDAGAEVATLKGYLAARQAPTFTVAAAQDSAEVAKSSALDSMGI